MSGLVTRIRARVEDGARYLRVSRRMAANDPASRLSRKRLLYFEKNSGRKHTNRRGLNYRGGRRQWRNRLRSSLVFLRAALKAARVSRRGMIDRASEL
nr:hypothetical protein CFP56_44355 [Quercus suber]